METTNQPLAQIAGPKLNTQPHSEKPSRPRLIRAQPEGAGNSQSLQVQEKTLAEIVQASETQALEELHMAKAALVTVQACQKQERFELSAQHSRQLAQQAQEKIDLQTKHATQLAQAEMRILELRGKFLEAQRRGGAERQLAKKEQKEMAVFEKESKFTRRTSILAAQQRLADIKEALEKLTVLASDWTHAGSRSTPAAEKMEFFNSEFLDIYEDGKLEGETPDEFIARQKDWLSRMQIQAREELALARTGPHALEKLKHLPPVFQPKEGATINWKARRKRLLFEGLAKGTEPLAHIS